MGSALSPHSQKAARARTDAHEDADKGAKKKTHPVLLHALSLKKQLMVARTRRRGGAKKVNPVHAHDEHRGRAADDDLHGAGKTNGSVALPVPKRVVMQASTGELLSCLSNFLRHRCVKLKELSSNQIILWFRKVDRALLVQGWQNQCFITPTSLVFVYLLCRDEVDEDTSSEQELHATFLTCLYLAYSYLGNEISYPLKPFLVESSRDVFWERVLELIRRLSADMLRINAEPHFFAEVFQDLRRQGGEQRKVGGGWTRRKNTRRQRRRSRMDRQQKNWTVRRRNQSCSFLSLLP
ncbi:hypothetical protein OJAV_G00016740 [Oryzias javanicus]|uniref:Cyclin-dependent kinase 5 activator n=1 Tax=Oryzias javanicus TaxID=123683 RepID=A0A437DLQ6_ORYJA|nr:hypothetical protein OJAV_G00016740 [Oryzias javanicus]